MDNHQNSKSPWLSFKRPQWPRLKAGAHYETVIIGAGISGVATLYYLLQSGQQSIALIEQSRVASGATGHNAGLAVAHIEKPLSALLETFPLPLIQEAYRELDQAWDALKSLYQDLDLMDEWSHFSSAAFGFNQRDGFIHFVEDGLLYKALGRVKWRYLVAVDLELPEHLETLVERVPAEEILKELKTIDHSYLALARRIDPEEGAARINSARFCYALLAAMEKQFPGCFTIFEESAIEQVVLEADKQRLLFAEGEAHCQRVILCTNGYRGPTLLDAKTGKEYLDWRNSLQPRLGYMMAYEHQDEVNWARAYLNEEGSYEDVPYWYLSQAKLSATGKRGIMVGGPEFEESEAPEAKQVFALMDQFIHNTLGHEPDYSHQWQGLMGYTQSGLRWVGQDRRHSGLWYNLGCNGIGILSAIAGARKIAKRLQGLELGACLFDPVR